MNDNRPLAFSYLRLSTDVQLKGHSRQRQLEASAAYAKQHGLQLVTHEDIGVSAFKGANVRGGSLGRFLATVKAGEIPVGSTLIVESLDRLSRQDVVKSQSLFLEIINSGIKVVTLQDGREYRPDCTRFEDLMWSLMVMSRAHDESLTKSKRVSAAWANKRSQAASKPITAMAPAWLQLNKEKNRFEKIPESVKVVKAIFEDTVAGMGTYVIASRLNRKKVPTFGHVTTRKDKKQGKSKGWYRSSVAAIITNRAVIGEYQPCKMIDGKRRPDGDPIKNYFPRIISDEVFYRAQQARRERRVSGRGRKGKYVTNLFSHLATCLYCGGRMTFADKGSPRGTYLVCEASKRGMGCGVRTGWRYDEFEKSFIAFVKELDLPSLIRNDDSEIRELDDAIQALEGRQFEMQTKKQKVLQVLETAAVEWLVLEAKELQRQEDETKTLVEAKKAEKQTLRSVESTHEEIKLLVKRLQTPTSQGDLYKLRSQVAARIKALVAELKIASVGTGPIMKKLIAFHEAVVQFQSLDPNTTDLEFKKETIESIKAAAHERYFEVTLKDKTMLRIMPNKDDPLMLEFKLETEVELG